LDDVPWKKSSERRVKTVEHDVIYDK